MRTNGATIFKRYRRSKRFYYCYEKLSSVKNEINNLVYGQNLVIDQILISILAEGHA